MLRTKLFEAWATRPTEYARDEERTQGHFTYDDVEKIMRAANPDLEVTPLEEVAERVSNAIRDDQFWILPENAASDETMRKRYESMRDRRNPDYFREWNPDVLD